MGENHLEEQSTRRGANYEIAVPDGSLVRFSPVALAYLENMHIVLGFLALLPWVGQYGKSIRLETVRPPIIVHTDPCYPPRSVNTLVGARNSCQHSDEVSQ
jgi:hypothetical protein